MLTQYVNELDTLRHTHLFEVEHKGMTKSLPESLVRDANFMSSLCKEEQVVKVLNEL